MTSDRSLLPRPPKKKVASKPKRVSVSSIAAAAKVSPAAVSSVLCSPDGRGRVSFETRALILKACRDLEYQPRGNGFTRIYPELGEFGFFLPSVAQCGFLNPYYATLFKSLMDALPGPHTNIHFCQFQADSDYHASPKYLPATVRNGVVTKAVFAGKPCLSLIQALLEKGVAVVCLGHLIPVNGVTSIFPDFRAGAAEAIECLIENGHRNIAVAGGPFADSSYNIVQQRSGVQSALEAHGISLAGENIHYVSMDLEAGSDVIDSLVRNPNRPTALYCLNDALALGAIQRAKMHGIRVPEDLSIIGFDDIPISRAASLTTVHSPIAEMGKLAVERIDAFFSDHDLRNQQAHFLLPTKLVKRTSVARPFPRA